MSKYFLMLFQTIFILNSISSVIIMNITTYNNTENFFITIREQVSNFSADIKVNNKTVYPVFSGENLYISKEPGEIEIIIYNNLSSLESLLYYNTKIESIKIKSSDQNVINLAKMFYNSKQLTNVDISDFDISQVTDFNYMFCNCGNLVSVKFGNYITINALDMDSMFYKCYDLVSLDLSSFDTSKVTILARLFYHCESLSSVNLKSFRVQNVKDFALMFSDCYSLTSLDLSNFITLEAVDMEYMFFSCESLENLDLNSFITSKVETMTYMFTLCNSLTDLKINNFDTSSVTDMSYMFYDCKFLTYLNLSNFIGTNITNTENMFSGCVSLTSLDINNFNPNKIKTMSKMFYSCFNLKSLDLSNFNTSLTTNMESMFFGCKSLTSLNINNFNTENVEDISNMFRECSSLTSLNLSNFIITDNVKYSNIFYGISKNLIYCVKDSVYEKIKSDTDKIKCGIRAFNCVPDWSKTSKKIISENGECVEKCNVTENFKYEYENKCYRSCPIGTTSLYNDNYLCQIFKEQEYKEFMNKPNQDNSITKNSQTNNFDTDNINQNNEVYIPNNCKANDFFDNKCVPNKYKSMIEIINEEIIDGLMNFKIDDIIKNHIDFYKIEDNIKYQITSSFNQKNNIYDNISVIDLRECENILKNLNDIPQNDTLIIFKYDYILSKTIIPIVGYEVFNPFTKQLLDINQCKNTTIDIILPANISKHELFKHDPNNNYYKDKCGSYQNEKGVDMTIYDRKKEYNDKNLALCPNNCDYTDYNNETKKVLCQCEPQYNSSLITYDKIINGKKLLHNFKNIKKLINIDVIKCYKNFLTLNGLKNNIGSYIILSIILVHILGLISFLIKGNKLLKEKIEKQISNDKNQIKTQNLIIDNPPIKKYLAVNNKKENNPKKNRNIKNSGIFNSNNNSSCQIKFKKRNRNLVSDNNKGNEDKTEIKYSDTELNIYEYSIAKQNDKRGYVKCYFSLVKTRHPLLSSFIPSNDYNLMSIKICLLFFTYALNFAVIVLFFTDETMHKIVEDEGIFNFIYNLPITIYSTIISFVFGFIIKKLASSEKTILEIRKEKNLKDIKLLEEKIKTNLNIKFVFFFIFSFISLTTFWFYIGCFGAVYINTQVYLIKDTLISFSFSLVTPFVIYLFACIIRMCSLNDPGQCLYKISQSLL